jgi:crossover junction endodeoxyribonuclease RuvC
MVMLGVDPGFQFAGYGIMRKEGGKTTVLDYGYLGMKSSQPLAVRVGIFHRFMTEKITAFGVTDLAIETPFLGKNAQNFLKLGYLRGILYLLSDTHGLVLHEYSPTQVKQSVTGYGGASKDQVARLIGRLLPAMQEQKKYDVTDALAVALCGIWDTSYSIMLR